MTVPAPRPGRHRARGLQIGRLLLVIAAAALWAAARLPWVSVRSADGLGQPRRYTVPGSSWSTGLIPLAVLALAAAVATVAARGWSMRMLAALLAAASLAPGYLGVSLWAGGDAAVRAAGIAGVPLVSLAGSERHYAGAGLTVVAAVCILLSAALLMRSAAAAGADKYLSSARQRAGTRRVAADEVVADGADDISERMIWDALDHGRDPTSDGEGR